MKIFLCICGWCMLPLWVFSQPVFTEVAVQRGVNHTATNTGPGGGVSFYDFDGDGWDDLTFATAQNEPLHFYRNNQGLFNRLPALVSHIGEAKHLLWVDYDNDGLKDLYVTTVNGANRLYRNLGDLQLLDVTTLAGLPVENHRNFGACWGDYNRDGWLDLYVGERKQPLDQSLNENRLFHNNADGTFTEVTDSAGVADRGRLPFCSAFLDIDNDGWPDLFTANDKQTRNTLLRNNGDGTFTDVSESSQTDYLIDGMNAGIGDFNNDGRSDIYVSNVDANSLLHQNLGPLGPDGETVFSEIAQEAGVGFYGDGWGGSWLDADLDGWLDFYLSGIYVGSDTISSAFYLNEADLTFSEPDAGFVGDTVVSYSNAIGDYNNDGYPDIAVLNHAPAKSHLWHNSGGTAHWLKVSLEGVLSNRDAIGSRIELYADATYQMRYIHCGIGFLAQNSGTELFGLGPLTQVDSLVITWPTGHRDRLYALTTDQIVHIVEGSTTGGDIFVDPDVSIIVATTDPATSPTFVGNIFPNPTSHYLHLSLTVPAAYRYMILSSSGQPLLQGKGQAGNFRIKVATLPPGHYHLIVWNTEGQRWVAPWQKH